MKLNRNSKLVRWAWATDSFANAGPPFLRDSSDRKSSIIPRRTSRCMLFWRTILWTPITYPCVSVVFLMLSGLFLIISVVLWPIIFILKWVKARIQKPDSTVGILIDGALSVKDRVCPIIELEDPDEQ